jgi:polar amino acid transport system substrate-binding protein
MPNTLFVPIPDNVSYESAAFVALGAISLHAIRTAEVLVGETIAVIGLGLLGLLAVQILKANGCHVIGMDIDPSRCQLAQELGCDETASNAEEMISLAAKCTASRGCDAVIILAATSSNQPIELAAEIAREQGRVVIPGLVGLNIPRKTFYEKELKMCISRAWGPGIYDQNYESGKTDYPFPFVRWTAQRNMAAFLDLVSNRMVSVDRLISHRFPIDRATEAYKIVTESKEPYIGILLTYPERNGLVDSKPALAHFKQTEVSFKSRGPSLIKNEIRIGFIGGGNFAKTTLLPIIRKQKNISLCGIADISGASASSVGKKFSFSYCTTDYKKLLEDEEINIIMITTPHSSHAPLVAESLKAGKHVYVEKPLAINMNQLQQVIAAFNNMPAGLRLMVGFNRRFSPFTAALHKWLSFTNEPMVVNCRVNAGFVPLERWEQDPDVGGGRIVGEVCHFVDLIMYLTGAYPIQVYAQAMKPSGKFLSKDNLVITIKMSNGSVASITYTASGDKSFPRERIEVFRGGVVGIIENFKKASFTRNGRAVHKRNLLNADRGHRAEIETFFSIIRNNTPSPVSLKDYVLTTMTTFSIIESLKCGEPVEIDLQSISTSNSRPESN